MKAVILAGGLGTRLSEETNSRPKPMVEIGGRPILWHIMKLYAHHGVSEFIVCCGYKGYSIKEYFLNYFAHQSNVTINLGSNKTTFHEMRAEPWTVSLVDTGDTSMTGGRLARVKDYIGDDEFFFTYGDGLSDVNITESLKFHRKHKGLATLTAVSPPGRFGALEMSGEQVNKFVEKPTGDGGKINGGFFILSPKVIDLIDSDNCVWEEGPMTKLAAAGELYAYQHEGFWQPMDTLRDKIYLNKLWDSKDAPWKVWS